MVLGTACGPGRGETGGGAPAGAPLRCGEFVAIVGFSGTGKTTLISLIAGLASPDGGRIELDGVPITQPGPDRGVVFRTFGMLDSLTRLELQDLLLEVWERSKITTLMVTHDVDEAIFLSDRVAMMTNGPGARVGGVLEIDFERPRCRDALL